MQKKQNLKAYVLSQEPGREGVKLCDAVRTAELRREGGEGGARDQCPGWAGASRHPLSLGVETHAAARHVLQEL